MTLRSGDMLHGHLVVRVFGDDHVQLLVDERLTECIRSHDCWCIADDVPYPTLLAFISAEANAVKQRIAVRKR